MMDRRMTVAIVLLALMAGCSRAPAPADRTAAAPTAPAVPVGQAPQTPAEFLTQYGLHPTQAPEQFSQKVPASWDVPLGAYPEGMYWGLANEFSKDAGLDLTGLKGRTVKVWRYNQAIQLPGDGPNSQSTYPSDIVLLVQNGHVAGAWLAFNHWGIGPSVKQRNPEQITGLSFDQWVERRGYFQDAGPNGDLSRMEPGEVLAAFLDAITKGDKTRATACLTPEALQNDLSVNLPPQRLYNPGFGSNNSMVENIVKGKLLSYTMYEPGAPTVALKTAGDRTLVELQAEVELTWRDAAFNSATGRDIRFAIMQKGPNGWKLNGLGTGP